MFYSHFTHKILCILHSLYSMFITTLLYVYYHFTSSLLTLFFRFTQRLQWVLSEITPGLLFSPAFAHTLLRFHSHVALVFKLFSGFYSPFSPGLFTLYFQLTQSLLWVFLTLYQCSTHIPLHIYSLFTQGLHTLYSTFYLT